MLASLYGKATKVCSGPPWQSKDIDISSPSKNRFDTFKHRETAYHFVNKSLEFADSILRFGQVYMDNRARTGEMLRWGPLCKNESVPGNIIEDAHFHIYIYTNICTVLYLSYGFSDMLRRCMLVRIVG